MKEKAIKDLCQFSDAQFFEKVSEGLGRIVENASQLERDSHLLAEENRPQGYKILESFATEEAAKFFILIDAVRCPKQPGNIFPRQLSYFNHHLPKGIYAYYYYLRPADFKAVCEWIESEKEQYYIDGPEGFEWIFRNRIISRREETIYVDLIEDDDGNYHWTTPQDYRASPKESVVTPFELPVLKLAMFFQNIGCTTPDSLKLIAEMWRPIQMNDDFSWHQLQELNIKTLEKLMHHNLLQKPISDDEVSYIIDRWLFPLYSLNLHPKDVDKAKLREMQERMAYNLYC